MDPSGRTISHITSGLFFPVEDLRVSLSLSLYLSISISLFIYLLLFLSLSFLRHPSSFSLYFFGRAEGVFSLIIRLRGEHRGAVPHRREEDHRPPRGFLGREAPRGARNYPCLERITYPEGNYKFTLYLLNFRHSFFTPHRGSVPKKSAENCPIGSRKKYFLLPIGQFSADFFLIL